MGDRTAVRLRYIAAGRYCTRDGWLVVRRDDGWWANRHREVDGPHRTLADVRIAIAQRRVGDLDRWRRAKAASRAA